MSNTQIRWNIWREWVLACILGSAAGSLVSLPIFLVLYRNDWGAAIGWTVIGVYWGVAQYIVLFRYLSKINGSWILASIVGVHISVAIAEHIFVYLGKNVGWAVVGAVGSIVQYLVLRRHLLRAYWWILASGIGVTIGMAVEEALSRSVARSVIGQPVYPSDNGLSEAAVAISNAVSGFIGLVVGGTVGLAVYGVITGGVLVWLLRHPRVTELN